MYKLWQWEEPIIVQGGNDQKNLPVYLSKCIIFLFFTLFISLMRLSTVLYTTCFVLIGNHGLLCGRLPYKFLCTLHHGYEEGNGRRLNSLLLLENTLSSLCAHLLS